MIKPETDRVLTTGAAGQRHGAARRASYWARRIAIAAVARTAAHDERPSLPPKAGSELCAIDCTAFVPMTRVGASFSQVIRTSTWRRSLLLPPSRYSPGPRGFPLSGVKRTRRYQAGTSAHDPRLPALRSIAAALSALECVALSGQPTAPVGSAPYSRVCVSLGAGVCEAFRYRPADPPWRLKCLHAVCRSA